jgi:1-acyl-sn-glycerol-3-phosphate acyltransferase
MPTSRDKIEKWSFTYYILKPLVDLGFNFYFKTTVSGLNNLPKDKTLIFAPNHQNALMDALAVLSVKPWQPIFLARADIFKKPVVSKILTFIKILPIYRMRDGFSNLQKNDEIFTKTIDVIKNKNGLVILPEGNHGDKKQLRPLKKGIARIALQAEEACDNKLDIQIVPVGLDYTDYIKVGSALHIRFGVPIGVKPFTKIYKENPAKAYNLLLSSLSKAIKAEMVDIEDEKYYSVYKILLDSFTSEYLNKMKLPENHSNAVDAQQSIIKKIDTFKQGRNDDFLLLAADALEYRLLLNRRKLRPEFFPMSSTQKWSFGPLAVLLLAFLPIFIYSFINILFPVGAAKLLSKKFLDMQFISSVRFAIGLVLTPIFHIIQLLVFSLVTGNLIWSLAYAVSLPLSYYIFFGWKKWANILAHRANELRLNVFNEQRMKRLYELNGNLRKQLGGILKYSDEPEYLSSRDSDV